MGIVETRYFQMWVNFGGMAVLLRRNFQVIHNVPMKAHMT